MCLLIGAHTSNKAFVGVNNCYHMILGLWLRIRMKLAILLQLVDGISTSMYINEKEGGSTILFLFFFSIFFFIS